MNVTLRDFTAEEGADVEVVAIRGDRARLPGVEGGHVELLHQAEAHRVSGSTQQGGQGRSGGDEVEGGVPTDPDTAGMAERVRLILEEIRNRASDRTRPAAEQDYLRRLMKQF